MELPKESAPNGGTERQSGTDIGNQGSFGS